MSQYERIKQKKLVRRRIKQITTSLLLVVVFGLWAIYGLLQSDFFNLKHIQVTGNQTLSQEEVYEISALVMERSIFKYNLKEVAQRIEKHPYVEKATLARKLPNTITISLKEREEYAVVSHMGSYLFIDFNGVVLKVEDSYLYDSLPLITGAVFESFTLGQPASLKDRQALEKALLLLEAAELAGLADSISEINIGENKHLKLITFDGIEVLLGELENPAYTVLALQEVLVNLYTNNRRNVIIDMRYGDNITVKDRTQWEAQE